MKRCLWITLTVLLCLTLALGGCSSAVQANLMAKVQAAEWPANPSPPDAAYAQAVADFSFKMFQSVASQSENVLVSPASIYLALAMALNGADQETKAAMLQALSSQGLSLETINQASRDWATLLNKTSDKTRLSVANSIWYRNGFTVDPAFLQTNADYFAAAAQALDFSKPEAVAIINSWVKDKTAGKIDKIVDKIDDNIVMYLMNAIYFKSDWKDPFDANKTTDQDFQAAKGPVTTRFMHKTANLAYLAQSGRSGVILPYVDERFAYFAILPQTGETAQDMAASLTAADLAALLASHQDVSVDLAMPKFEIRYENALNDELTSLGMGLAFEPGKADFSLMQSNRNKDLYITKVFHKTYCKVDEKGTEAAAVTSVEVGVTSMPASDHQLVFDRPFLYGILDTQTGVPLFIGVLDNPAQTAG